MYTQTMEVILEQTKNFLLNNQACKDGMAVLKEGSQISVVIDRTHICLITKTSSSYNVETIKEKTGDASLLIQPDAINSILNLEQADLAELGIHIIKQIFIEKIEIEVHASVLQLIRKGYFKLPITAGAPLISFLSSYGWTHMNKIYQWIEKRRK